MWSGWPRGAKTASAAVLAFVLVASGMLMVLAPPTSAAAQAVSPLQPPMHDGPYPIFNFKNADSATVDPKTGFVYVADEGFDRTTVWDPASSRVVRFIDGVAGAMVYDPATGELVVLQGDGAVFVNATSGTILATVSGLAPDGWRRPVLVLDAKDDLVLAAYNFQTTATPGGIWLGSTIQVLSVPRHALVASVSGLWFTQGMAYDPVNGRVYVDDVLGGMTAIDARTQTAVSSAKGIFDGPNGIAYDPGTGDLYVACFNGRIVNGGWGDWTANITVVDPATLAVVGNIPGFGAPWDGPQYIAYDPVDGQLYVANGTGIFEMQGGGAGSGMTGLSSPGPLAVDPVSGRVYSTQNDALLELSPQTGGARVDGNGYDAPYAVAVDTNRDRVYVSNYNGGVVVIDGTTDQIAGMIRGLPGTTGLAYDAQQDRLFVGVTSYVSAAPTYSIAAIDLATEQVVGNLTGVFPWQFIYDNRSGDLLAVTDSGLTAFDAGTLEPVANLSGNYGGTLAFDSAGERLFVATPQFLYTIDAAHLELLANVTLHAWVTALGYDPANGDLYAGTWGNGTAVIDPATGRVLAEIPGPSIQQGVVYNPANGYVYVTNWLSEGPLQVIDPATNQVVADLPLPDGGNLMAYNPLNQEVYVALGDPGMGGGLVVAVPSAVYGPPSPLNSLANPWVSGVLVLGALTGIALAVQERRRQKERRRQGGTD